MAHNPVIPKSESCSHENVFEYWHETHEWFEMAECSLDECAVNECQDCGEFATECATTTGITCYACGEYAEGDGWTTDDSGALCLECSKKEID